MSSDRPGWPADVVPEGEDPRATGSTADTGPIRPAAGRRGRRREQEAKKGSLLRELPVLLLIAFVLALLVKTFLVQAFFIPSGSMERSEEHTSELQSRQYLVCRLLLEKKKKNKQPTTHYTQYATAPIHTSCNKKCVLTQHTPIRRPA